MADQPGLNRSAILPVFPDEDIIRPPLALLDDPSGVSGIAQRVDTLEQKNTAMYDYINQLQLTLVHDRDLLVQRMNEFLVEQLWTLTTPSQITANQNDYDLGDGIAFRLDSDASRNITGLANGIDGRVMILFNIGSNNIVLQHQNTSSTAVNRLLNDTGADITLQSNQVVFLWYDLTTNRWRGSLWTHTTQLDQAGIEAFGFVTGAHTVVPAATDSITWPAVSPSQITGDQHDYSLGEGVAFRLSSDTSRHITGLADGTDGRILFLMNVGSNDLVFQHQNSDSSETNRLLTNTGGDVTLRTEQAAFLWYDSTTERWRFRIWVDVSSWDSMGA